MTKITLADLTSIQNDPTAVDTINDNSAIIEAAFDNTLSRDGTSPNEMDANIDMNNNRILNLPRPLNPNEPARLRDVGDAYQYAQDAAQSAAEAAASASSADSSATSASNDAAAAHADRLLADADVVLTHADVVLTHADVVTTGNNATTATTQAGIATTQAGIATTQAGNAATSAGTATTQAGIATTQAGIATTQAGNAATSASNAHTSELNAATSETNAGVSETNAAASAAAALVSENNAATSESNAATSESNAAASEAAAATSESNAATSETNAATSASNALTSETNAATSESNAATSAANALTSENNAEQSLEDFQDIYLGAYATDPTVTPTGAPVATGMLYWNTGSTELRIYDGASWAAYSPATGGAVSSVFGRTGAVVAANGDYAFSNLSGNISTSQMNSGTGATSSTFFRGDGTWASPGGGVTSWNGRTGAVVPVSADYTVAQVTGAAPLASPALTGTPTAPTATAGTSTTQIATTAFVTGAVRERLTANRTYYVSTTGSNSNNGLTVGAPFLTIQKAIDTIAALDISVYNVTIQLADGTYTAGGLVTGPWIGSGNVFINGNATTPANVVINAAGGNAIYAVSGGRIAVSYLELRGNVGAIASVNSYIQIGSGVRFGAVVAYQMYATRLSTIDVTADYSIVGGGLAHIVVDGGSNVYATSRTITLTGTPAFTTYIQCSRIGYVGYFLNTFSGSATGSRYSVGSGGFLDVNGASTTYLPGNAAGTGTNYGVAPWGLYA